MSCFLKYVLKCLHIFHAISWLAALQFVLSFFKALWRYFGYCFQLLWVGPDFVYTDDTKTSTSGPKNLLFQARSWHSCFPKFQKYFIDSRDVSKDENVIKCSLKCDRSDFESEWTFNSLLKMRSSSFFKGIWWNPDFKSDVEKLVLPIFAIASLISGMG